MGSVGSSLTDTGGALANPYVDVTEPAISQTLVDPNAPIGTIGGQAIYDPSTLHTVGTPDETNSSMLDVLKTAIATAGSLGAIAIGAQKIRPGAGAANPARPGIMAAGTAGSIQTVLIVGAVVLLAIAAFKAFGKK